MHAFYNISTGDSQGCRRCHSDHNGEDFQLVKWDIQKFNHAQAGYTLEGKHANLRCSQCHNAQRVARDQLATIKVKDPNKTFLGLPQTCTTCHQDEHKGRLGSDCLQCHGYNDWKTLSIGKFDHSKTRYPLTGLHAEVACQRCHTPGPDRKPRYTGIPFRECADCHQDPHGGAFPQNCKTCHTTNGWKKISQDGLDQQFDHSKTKYPLLGKHAKVECAQCHVKSDFRKPLPFAKCAGCHDDYHAGQFSRRDNGACEQCHTVQGFKSSTFGVKEHAATRYPLEGGHARLQCGQCHVPKGKATQFLLKFDRCTDCHADRHAGQFEGPPYLNACEKCHNLKGYVPSTFTREQHQRTRFSLTGGHAAVPCEDCHKQSTQFRPPTAQYHWTTIGCTECHADPHSGQFALLMQSQKSGKFRGCEVCHSTVSWTEMSHFDHSKTSFQLFGTHRTIACRACHKPINADAGVRSIDFKVAPYKCESCHADVHGKQFARAGQTACDACHDSVRWKPTHFDHDRQSSFPLVGAHRQAACAGCHKSTRAVNGKTVLFYKPAPKQCAACHRRIPLPL